MSQELGISHAKFHACSPVKGCQECKYLVLDTFIPPKRHLSMIYCQPPKLELVVGCRKRLHIFDKS